MPFQGKGWYHVSGSKLPKEEFKSKEELEKLSHKQLLKYLINTFKDMGLIWIATQTKYEKLKSDDTLGIRFIEMQEATIERAMMSKKKLH